MKPLYQALLATILAACSNTPPQPPSGITEPAPNIVLIVVDDLGWTDLGCHGNRFHETPNIDSLSAGGGRFTSAYAAGAVSSPTRAAILTGRHPARIGVTDWIRGRYQRPDPSATPTTPTAFVGGPRLRLECPPNPFWMEHSELTIAEILKRSGYHCGHIGKWNLGDDAWNPTTQGFDENYGGSDLDHPPSYFDPFANRQIPGIPHLPPRREGEYLTDREADEAVRFIRRNQAKPFFLQISHHAVHMPHQAKPDAVERFAAKQAAQDPLIRHRNAKYAAMIDSVDQAVGAVIRELCTLGLRDRTLVCFTSDNGGLLGATDNTPLRAGKGFPYEGGIRVPLLLNWPGRIEAGSVIEDPVTSIDLLPTITELVGSTLATDPTVDGVSLVAAIPGLQETTVVLPVRDLVWHYPHYRGKISPYSILRQGHWKLIYWYEDDRAELFDLDADLSEAIDLSAKRPAARERLNATLRQQLKKVGAQRPRPNPRFGDPIYSREVHPDNAGKPRVLLIGDSISMGYTEIVRRALHGKAAVFRPMLGPNRTENCQGTLHGIKSIDSWLAAEGGNWDVIHFNFGLHDLKRVHPVSRKNSNDPKHPYQSSPEQYELQLRSILKLLVATGAELIFATTTPVPEGVRPHRGVEDPERYNDVANRLMKTQGIPINDLHAFVVPRLAEFQNPGDVHFRQQGSEALAGEVVRHIEAAVARRRRR